MNFDFITFALTCAGLYIVTVFLAAYAYTNNKMSPCNILLCSMGMTAFVTTCLVYVIMIVFRG